MQVKAKEALKHMQLSKKSVEPEPIQEQGSTYFQKLRMDPNSVKVQSLGFPERTKAS